MNSFFKRPGDSAVVNVVANSSGVSASEASPSAVLKTSVAVGGVPAVARAIMERHASGRARLVFGEQVIFVGGGAVCPVIPEEVSG